MRITRVPWLATGLAVALGLTSAQAQEVSPSDDASRFQITGTVTAINERDHEILIVAEGVPEMRHHHPPLPFEVPDSIPMSRFHVGDRVSGDLIMSSNWMYMENVVVLDAAEAEAKPHPRKTDPGTEGRRKPGDIKKV